MQTPSPFVLVLAPDPGGRGGIQRATRALLNALVRIVGEDHVGTLAIWGGPMDADVAGRMLRTPPQREGESARVRAMNKVRYAWDVVRAARAHRGDLVIINVHAWLSPVAWLAAKVGRARYAQWSHGSEVWFHLGRTIRMALPSASLLFAPSAFTLSRLREAAGAAPIPGEVVPYPLEERPGAAPPDPGTSPVKGPFILTVARLDAGERRKGVDATIRALPAVLKQRDLRYVVVGDGGDRGRLQAIAAEMGVEGHVDFLGELPDDQLQALYRDALVFCMPSGQEGFGIVYVEAGWYGTPSVAGFFGGAPEAVIDGETGLVVPFDDVEELGQALIRLVTDEPFRQRLGTAAQQRARTRHSFEDFETNVAGIVDLLR